MVRRPGYIPKKRASGNREINRVLLVSVEGNKNNKTERNYLKYWKDVKTKVQFVSGNETDPEKMMQRLIDEYETGELTEKDLAVCLIDSDFSEDRNVVIAKVDAMAKSAAKEQLHLIVSSPCFEIWYICHFQYSTRQYQSADEVLSHLRQFIPDYEKSKDVYASLQGKEDVAIRNAQKLEKYCMENGKRFHHVEFMPSTEMYKVMKWIKREEQETR